MPSPKKRAPRWTRAAKRFKKVERVTAIIWRPLRGWHRSASCFIMYAMML
jgi:hypothetical protein